MFSAKYQIQDNELTNHFVTNMKFVLSSDILFILYVIVNLNMYFSALNQQFMST